MFVKSQTKIKFSVGHFTILKEIYFLFGELNLVSSRVIIKKKLLIEIFNRVLNK